MPVSVALNLQWRDLLRRFVALSALFGKLAIRFSGA